MTHPENCYCGACFLVIRHSKFVAISEHGDVQFSVMHDMTPMEASEFSGVVAQLARHAQAWRDLNSPFTAAAEA